MEKYFLIGGSIAIIIIFNLGYVFHEIIEVSTFKMPVIVFWYDSGHHTFEGILTALILAFFYKRFVLLKL